MTTSISTYEGPLRLIDGRTVLVRAVGPGDADLAARLYSGLSPHSMAMRFGAARRGLDAEDVVALVRPPGPEGLGVMALSGGEAERAVALARYDRRPGASDAEFSIAVADDWQGKGLGTDLLEVLLTAAADDGLDALWAVVRPDNYKMLIVFRDLGCEEHELHQRGEVLVRLLTPPDEGFDEAASARFMATSVASLRPVFRPASIAVVGASRDRRAPGGAVLHALRSGSCPFPVFAVNRAAQTVDGVRAYPSLGAVPEHVDLAIVAVPAAGVTPVAREAAANGVRALIVLSMGFSEADAKGAEREAELLHVARTSGMRVVGPNCMGVSVTDPACPFNATFGPGAPPGGSIALASQSGGLGIAALEHCRRRGIGLSSFVSLGNMADVSPVDLLAWWDQDDRTRAILLYLEGLADPRRFARVARRVARSTPIVALKSGRGRSGRRAAGSHTAALAAGEETTDALFSLAGIVRVDAIEDLFDAGQLLAAQPLPAGDRIGILTNAGGLGVVAADACEAVGLQVPQLSDAVRARLVEMGVASADNPVDLGSGVTAETLETVGRMLIDGSEVDALVVVYAPIAGGDEAGIVAATERLSGHGLTVAGCMLNGDPPTGASGLSVPWYGFPEAAVRAVDCAVEARAIRDRPADPATRLPDTDRSRARHALARTEPGAWLAYAELAEMLEAYGLTLPRSRAVSTAAQAAAAQAELGVPVAVKLLSTTTVHKTEVGGVILGCATPQEAATAFETIAARVGSDEMTGALVQEMAPAGLDLIVGAVNDPLVGPLVLAGFGGVEAEVWQDRAVALAPVGPRTAGDLWGELRGRRLLDGWRGAPGADRDALTDLVTRVARLAAEQPLLAELDLNPVRSCGAGTPLAILDARARRAGTRG
jgi:acyl-CoA synthetase (NDP forming)/GNAT superfamily N-acetyltransferase